MLDIMQENGKLDIINEMILEEEEIATCSR